MKERGQIFLAILMLIIVAGIAAFYTFFSPSSVRLENEKGTQKILLEAKEALIGFAAASSLRPGQLPCPDTNNDGDAEPLNGAGDCPNTIGRLPWRTLGLDDPRDAASERLWYAVSVYFSSNPPTATCPLSVPADPSPTKCYLNSDTKGDLTVYQDSTATVITSNAVAVIFAPGLPIAGQVRDAANSNNPANYLDVTGTINNATPAANPLPPSFVRAESNATFNDRVLVIDTSILMPVVEQRVAREILGKLKQYKDAIGVYPWPDCSDGKSDDDYVNRGRVPWRIASLPPSGYTYPLDWGSGGAPFLPGWISTAQPGWFINNYWSWVIYYAVGKDYLQSSAALRPPWTPGGIECAAFSCVDPTLTVTGLGSKEVVIIMAGPAGARPTPDTPRPDPANPPGASSYCSDTVWGLYLDDSSNIKREPRSDNVPLTYATDDTYAVPVSGAYARDRMYFCPGTPGIC